MARPRQVIQREVADEILDKLSGIGIDAFLAGGAPRDWYFEKDASDLDFFFDSDGSTREQVMERLEAAGIGVLRPSLSWQVTENVPAGYSGNPDLEFVIEAAFKGERMQFMGVKDTSTVVENFPLSLCQATYKDGAITTTRLFELGLQENMIFRTGKEYNSKQDYFAKIKQKFPNFTYVGF